MYLVQIEGSGEFIKISKIRENIQQEFVCLTANEGLNVASSAGISLYISL
jgi:hypothetical protein